MIIKIGLLLLVFACGYRFGDAAGIEKGYRNCLKEIVRNCRHYNLKNIPEVASKKMKEDEVQKGLDEIYGKKEIKSGADS